MALEINEPTDNAQGFVQCGPNASITVSGKAFQAGVPAQQVFVVVLNSAPNTSECSSQPGEQGFQVDSNGNWSGTINGVPCANEAPYPESWVHARAVYSGQLPEECSSTSFHGKC